VKAQPTGTIERSKATFVSLDAYAKDASAHGYGEWKKDERRQAEVRNDVLETVDLSAAVRSLRLAPTSGTAGT
jgi:hypothetical protein